MPNVKNTIHKGNINPYSTTKCKDTPTSNVAMCRMTAVITGTMSEITIP